MSRLIPYITIAVLLLFLGYITLDAIQTLAYDVQNIDGWGHTKP